MPATAILFPGQGSHTDDMREQVAQVRPDLLDKLTATLGEDPFPRVNDGTNFAQPAIFCASLAGWEALGKPHGDFMAGHSLGELAALVAAGALSEQDGLELVVLRGALMARGEEGGMLALLGRGASENAEALAEAHGLTVANDNSPQQVVLSGPRENLAPAEQAAREIGLKAMPLDVTGAFHSPLMTPALAPFEEALRRKHFSTPRPPVMSAVTAEPFDDIPLRLAQALTHPVRWRETLLALKDLGVEKFIEVGPGKVLTGLAKRTLQDVELVHA